MQIFPNSPDKKKDMYPKYMRKAAQVAAPGEEVTEEPFDDAFEAIKGLPMFGEEPAATEVTEVPAAVPGTEIPVADAEKPASVEQAVEKAQEAVEQAAVAVSEVAEAVKAPEAAKDEGKKDESPAGVAEVVVEVEDKDEAKDEGKKDEADKPDFLKKESDPAKKEEACAEKEKPSIAKEEDKCPECECAKSDCKCGKSVEASAIGGFVRMAHLSPQTKKEVFDYWKALGMPEEWCKALTKNNE